MSRSGRTKEEEANIGLNRYLDDAYFSPNQWVSYCGQINAVRHLSPKTVLEIGIGNGIVQKILDHLGMKVTTFDINAHLNPDILGSITDLAQLTKGTTYDCVLCAEVLEHLPFNLFEQSLANIAAVSNKHAVITLPRSGKHLLYCNGQIPRRRFDISLRIPSPQIPPVHHWEIDNASYSRLAKIVTAMNKYFVVNSYYRMPQHPRHYVFVLNTRY